MRTACFLFITLLTAAACDEEGDDHDTTAGPEASDTDGDTDTSTTDADATGDPTTTDAASTGDAPGDTSVGGPQTTIAGPGDVHAPRVGGA